jgi:hypothetical protein
LIKNNNCPEVFKTVRNNKREYLYIDDAIDAILLIETKAKVGEVYCLSGNIYLSIENKSNSIILITLLFMFFSYQVYQRYYDPMFFIIFFLLIKTNLTKIFFKKKIPCYLLLFYFILFYLGTVSKLLYKL